MIQHWHKLGNILSPEHLCLEGTSTAAWISGYAAVPIALHLNNNVYRVYFSARDRENSSVVGFIEIDLTDPYRVLTVSPIAVLTKGVRGVFDDSGTMASWILRHEHKEYLYYIGWNLGVTVPFRNSIGLAVSDDAGQTFTKISPAPILDRNALDPFFVASSAVMREDNLWRMWYLSCTGWETIGKTLMHRYHIKYAESSDGIEWRREGKVAIDFRYENEYAISRPSVLKDVNGYNMWYSYRGGPYGSTYRIGYALSEDGITWIRRDELVRLDVSGAGWDSEMLCYPFVFDHNGKRYMLYNGNGYGKTGIGLAIME